MSSSYSLRSILRSANFTARAPRLGHRMTRHAAAAVVVFALAQIWLVSAAIEAGAPRMLGIIALLGLVAFAIPFARRIERRWHRLGQQALPSPALTQRFYRDVRWLWLLAVLLPAAWVGTAMLVAPAIAAI